MVAKSNVKRYAKAVVAVAGAVVVIASQVASGNYDTSAIIAAVTAALAAVGVWRVPNKAA